MSRRRVFLLALVAFLLIPAAVLAGTLFTDVDDTSTHFNGIKYMKDTGITLGCGDGTTFCPKDPVLREQMATFMYRMSGNDPSTPASVNADKLDGKDSTEFLGKAEKAADADLLDGQNSSAFWRFGGTIPPFSTVYGTIGMQLPVSSAIEIGDNASLPIPAHTGIDDDHVTVAGGADDTAGNCTGDWENPTAALGHVCIYPYSQANTTIGSMRGYQWGSGDGSKYGFQVSWNTNGAGTTWMFATWAYTSPLIVLPIPLSTDSTPGAGGN